MKKTILKMVAFTILIGVIALCFNNALGKDTVIFLNKETVYYGTDLHWNIWKFDFWKYIENLRMSTSDLSVLVFTTPTRQWQEINDIADFGNNLLVILDYIILIINLLLYPLKIGGYLIQNVLAILGINHNTSLTNNENGLAWLVMFVRELFRNIAIPYI